MTPLRLIEWALAVGVSLVVLVVVIALASGLFSKDSGS